MDSYYKLRQLFFTKSDTVYQYKLRQVLQNAMNLLQIATGITKCYDYYKLRQYSSTLFLYISLPLFSMITTRNFQKPFYGGNAVRVLIHFFFTAAHFLLALVAANISHFVTTAKKFSRCSYNKKNSPLFFLSHSRSLSPFFSLSFAGLPPTLSFSLSFS